MGWFQDQGQALVQQAQANQAKFPNSYGIDPNQTVMGLPIGQMLQQYNQSQQQQSNPWGATPATPNAVQSGSLAALGGGMNGPQPVPGVQPVPFDPNSPFGKDLFDPGWGIEKGPQGNRGSGQPVNQPMTPPPFTRDPSKFQDAYNSGQNWIQQGDVFMPPGGGSIPQTGGSGANSPLLGSLQSLGGGQLNSSGMVNLRGPDGSMKAVPQSDLSHWLSKGAVRV